MWEVSEYDEVRTLCSACVRAEIPAAAPGALDMGDDMVVHQIVSSHALDNVEEVRTGVCDECGTERF